MGGRTRSQRVLNLSGSLSCQSRVMAGVLRKFDANLQKLDTELRKFDADLREFDIDM